MAVTRTYVPTNYCNMVGQCNHSFSLQQRANGIAKKKKRACLRIRDIKK